MRGVTVRQNGGLPPLPFGRTEFDLVLGYSVLTHLDEAYQDAWLDEFSRRTSPGGLLLLTIHGEAMWRQITEGGHPRIGELTARRAEWDRKGILFWDGDDWERFFPAYYHTTFHSHDYVKARWSKWFDVVHILEGTPELRQEIVVLRRR
jgi:SAM-dependent methyltransferase